jgi:integral membrane protein (TIGR01906 family)
LRVIEIAARWLFRLGLPVLLLSATIAAGANSLRLYTYAAAKYEVSDRLLSAGLQLSDAQLARVYADFIHYYNSGNKYVNITVEQDGRTEELLTPEETFHFIDVKSLIRLDYAILLISLLYVLAYTGFCLARRQGRELALEAAWGGGLTLGFILLLLLLNTFSGFDWLFYRFHLLFFDNDFWSAPGNMLRLFPEGLFIDAATYGVLAMALASGIIGGAGMWYRRSRGEKP